MINIKNKISYFLILTAMVVGCGFACANEVVRSEEIVSETLRNMMENDDNNSPSVFMGGNPAFNKSESYKYAVDADRPEFEIKNLSDYVKEKKAAKEQAEADKPNDDKEGMQIECTEMEYFEERNGLEARGNV